MELQKLNLTEYCDLLGSDAPAPGGGSAAALSGAQGAALSAMVCALTLGRKKYAEFQELAEEGFQQASEQKSAFLSLMEADTEAYNGFRAAVSLPKQTDAEKAARKAEMEKAAVGCTLVPAKIMFQAVITLELTRSLLGKTNQNAVSDLGVAALNLKAALIGAWLNVKINLPGLPNEAMAADFRHEGEVLLKRGSALADEIVKAVEDALS